MRIIGICGPKYSGKDTAGNFLAAQNKPWLHEPQYFRMSKMAEGVKNIVEEVFGWGPELYEDPVLKETKLKEWPFIEPRWPMMDIANWMRDKYGGDVWARRWERLALHAQDKTGVGAHVITDVRFPEELDMIRRHDSLLVYIKRPEAEEALSSGQKKGNLMALNPSELHYEFLQLQADIVIDNDRMPHHLKNAIHGAVNSRFGHWKYWSQNNG
jgi:hypothetical protein